LTEDQNEARQGPIGKKDVFALAGVGAKKESAVMLGVLVRHDWRRDSANPLAELAMLADTCGVEIRGQLIQKLDRPHAATYAGKGTVEKLAALAKETGVDTVICDNDLSPAQLRNLERACQVKVVDRTDLILDIFAQHARTQQARLQVELAQLQYTRPRLRKMWTHLLGEQGGVGFRGPGEKQLEMDKRTIDKRIKDLRKRLETIRQRKEREVGTRHQLHTIALVGYTNAGKSTLFEALTGAETYVADRLFATLDTRTRPFKIRSRLRGVLSDTVGFIDNLPHRLVESFHATLEEVLQADLLIHVVDVAGEDPLRQVEAVNTVLEKIGCIGRPVVTAMNKVDLAERASVPFFQKRLTQAIPVSAVTGEGLELLKETIALELTRSDRHRRIFAPHREGRFIAALDGLASEIEKEATAEGVIMTLWISDSRLGTALRLARSRDAILVEELSPEAE